MRFHGGSCQIGTGNEADVANIAPGFGNGTVKLLAALAQRKDAQKQQFGPLDLFAIAVQKIETDPDNDFVKGKSCKASQDTPGVAKKQGCRSKISKDEPDRVNNQGLVALTLMHIQPFEQLECQP